MPKHRRIGSILMAVGALLAISSVLLSSGFISGVDLLPQLANARLEFACNVHGSDCQEIMTKHALIGCLVIFVVGFLSFIGVMNSTPPAS